MKQSIHPNNYRLVVFEDLNNGEQYIINSTIDTPDVITINGQEYPYVKVHISRTSHPFFTGQEKLVDIEGRVDKFEARRLAAQKAKEEKLSASSKVRSKKSTESQKIGANRSNSKKADQPSA